MINTKSYLTQLTQVATFVTTETRRPQRKGITRVAALRRDVTYRKELAATHIIHAVALHGVEHHVVLFFLAASLRGLLTVGGRV